MAVPGDALALVAKSAWAAVGGYPDARLGWEDYEFWCRLVERGHWGEKVSEELAEYRAHDRSMLRNVTEIAKNKKRVLDRLQKNHPWLTVAEVLDRERRACRWEMSARR